MQPSIHPQPLEPSQVSGNTTPLTQWSTQNHPPQPTDNWDNFAADRPASGEFHPNDSLPSPDDWGVRHRNRQLFNGWNSERNNSATLWQLTLSLLPYSRNVTGLNNHVGTAISAQRHQLHRPSDRDQRATSMSASCQSPEMPSTLSTTHGSNTAFESLPGRLCVQNQGGASSKREDSAFAAGVPDQDDGRQQNSVQQNPLTLRFQSSELERAFQAEHAAARLPVDKWGDPFIMLLVVIALLWRCKTVSESCITGGFLLIYFAKLLLRLLAPEVSLQYRAGVVSTMRGVMILVSIALAKIQVSQPRVYAISGSVPSLCCTIFMNSRLITLTLQHAIQPLPWTLNCMTTVGSLALVLVQLLPKVCTAEHLSNPPTKAAIQYLSSALKELAGVGAIRVGTFRTVNLSTAEIGCRQLHIFALVFWGCIVPLTAAYLIERRQRKTFIQQHVQPVTPNQDSDVSDPQDSPQMSDTFGMWKSLQGSGNDIWPAMFDFGGYDVDATLRMRARLMDGRAQSANMRNARDREQPRSVAGELLVAAAIMPIIGTVLWHLIAEVCTY